MKTGIASHLRRAILPLERKIVQQTSSVAHIHGLGFANPPFGAAGAAVAVAVPMFNRAVKAAEANQPPKASAPANNTHLKQQLFPSSSPSTTPAPKTNTTIHDLFKKPRIPSGSAGLSRSATATEPLQSRSSNISRAAVPTRGVNGKAFASLYDTADSFNEVIDLLSDDGLDLPAPARPSNPSALVYIAEDDFSDDENLDLDFQAPSALPSLPVLAPPQYRHPTHHRPDEPLPESNTSALSWSQSSPSHYVRPKHEPEPAPRGITKRASPEDDDRDSMPIKKPKRQLPKDWRKTALSGHQEDIQELDEAMATPAAKPKGDMLWNTTASAVKAQKKQLKTQKAGKIEASAEDMKAAMDANAAKKRPITLSEEQRHVKGLVVEKGQSVFFTGPAGTGKSVLMRSIIQDLKKKFARDPERIAVTASTGLAACNIGGMTLHSFAGIGLGKEDAQSLVKKIRRNPKAKNRWLRTKVLVIDEISMVDGDLFDKLSQIGRIIRNNGRPWGGIQLVITGDFFQLPPVPDGSNKRESKFAFDAATWNMSIDHTIGLTEVFRQRDSEFADMLNEMRLGRITEKTIRNFQALSRPLHFDDGLEVTELFPTRHEVENSNQRRLKALPGKVYRYDSRDTGDPAIRERLLANMMAPPAIELKVGAQVMLIKNMDETLVNGSLGKVMKFMTEASFELGPFDDGLGSDTETDAKKRVRAFTNALSEGKADNAEYPMVKFHAVDGSERRILMCPEEWKVELPTGEVQASRTQLPLILAWALSIHKAQGQTLERVKVDLGKVFEKGQAYVALSRATTQEGLQVLRFSKDKVMAHPRVVGFYNKLYSAESALKKRSAASFSSFVHKQGSAVDASSMAQGRDIIDLDDDEEALAAAYG